VLADGSPCKAVSLPVPQYGSNLAIMLFSKVLFRGHPEGRLFSSIRNVSHWFSTWHTAAISSALVTYSVWATC
jgi:hypothetical protein